MKRVLFAVAAFFVASSVWAQSPATSYTTKFYNVGAPSPLQTETFVASTAVCNQAAPTGVSTVNPTRLVWTDPDPTHISKVCIATEQASGLLFSLPLGSFEATLSAVNAVGVSGESNRAPFSRDAALPAPTAFSLVR